MTRVQEIIQSLQMVYDGDPWFGKSVLALLQSVDPEKVLQRPDSNSHSAAALLNHMISWKKYMLEHLKGNDAFNVDQEQSFDWRSNTGEKKDAWIKLIDQFQQVQEELISVLETQDDSILNKQVEGKSYTYEYALTGIIHHDIYHIGQIAYISKLGFRC